MKHSRTAATAAAALLALSSCTVIELDGRSSPAGVQADGLIDGHAVFGISGETSPLRLQVLDGRGSGSVLELAVWKLFRVELGLAGFSLGLGPFDVGLGVLFYDPALPPQPPRDTPKKQVAPPPSAAPAQEPTPPSPPQPQD